MGVMGGKVGCAPCPFLLCPAAPSEVSLRSLRSGKGTSPLALSALMCTRRRARWLGPGSEMEDMRPGPCQLKDTDVCVFVLS